jgi:hypothetical protein
MTLEAQVSALTTATTQLLSAVNVGKATLDERANTSVAQAAAALASAAAANTSAGASAGSAAQALAIFGSTAIQQAAVTAAANSASVAAGHAASAASVAQQDLSGVNAAALHRSPNAVTALFVYDTAKDSDGGAWRKRMAHTSWMNEPLAGKWLGAQASEAAARAVAGAVTGDYFQRTTDGRFWSLNATSGITETFRGNKAEFPALSAIVAEASSVTIYDLTAPGNPMWMRFVSSASNALGTSGVLGSLAALNGQILIGTQTSNGGLHYIQFIRDLAGRFTGSAANSTDMIGWLAQRNNAPGRTLNGKPLIISDMVNAVAMTVLPDAPIDSVSGLAIPTIAVATASGISVIQNTGIVRNSLSTLAVTKIAATPDALFWTTSAGVLWAANPGSLGAGFAAGGTYNTTTTPAQISLPTSVTPGRTKAFASALGITLLRDNPSLQLSGLAAAIGSAFNSGYMTGDIRRCWLSDTGAGVVTGPEVIADRTHRNRPLSIIGSLTKAPVAPGAQLMAYSGFSAVNYGQEAYDAGLDFGTGAWTASAWVNYTTAVVSVIADRSAATGSRITFGTSATGQITATAFDGTTTRVITSPAAYNNGAWAKARVDYTVNGTLSLRVNGVVVATTTGAPLLSMNNANAVTTVGNNRELNAPFPGSLALVKVGATIPTPEQGVWMYEQEKQMFRDGAQVCLPDSGAVVDLAYDDLTDRWTSVSATNEAAFSGLVRTRTAPSPAGTFTRIAKQAGVRLASRITTNPGVDITMSAQGLREELVRRNEAAAAASKPLTVFNFDSVAAQVDFVLPAGYTAIEVLSAGSARREGPTRDWVRVFDGFIETVRFAVAPGAAVWVQINARKA